VWVVEGMAGRSMAMKRGLKGDQRGGRGAAGSGDSDPVEEKEKVGETRTKAPGAESIPGKGKSA
jgi:hypothetical protein